MSVKAKAFLRFIRQVGSEQGFEVTDGDTTVKVYIQAHHGVAFLLKINNAGYLQAHQWECDSKGRKGRYGRAVYSIRSHSDVAQFCALLIASSTLRARRRGDTDEP